MAVAAGLKTRRMERRDSGWLSRVGGWLWLRDRTEGRERRRDENGEETLAAVSVLQLRLRFEREGGR
uniref:Uncharacterized protein n=1 Tax=Manihot esculenta TaxID=3983 RepID=A0A2C9V4C3_MANES